MYHDLLTNFTGGIGSPDILARVDMEKYPTFLKDCQNGILKPYGGVYKRMGSVNMGTTYGNNKARLIVFKQPESDYLLEFTEYHLRVWYNGEVIADVTSPYSYELVEKLKYIKSADTMFIVCGDLPIYELRHSGDSWTFNELTLEIPPFDELVDDGTTLKFSATTGNVTITASQSFFTSDMIGDRLKIYQEVGTQTQVEELKGSSGGATKECDPVYVGSTWSLRTSGSWSGTVTLSRSKDGEEYVEYATYVSNDKDYNASDTGSVETNDGYYYKVTFTEITEGTCTVTFTSYSYTAEGIVEITAVSSGTSASGKMIRDIASTDEIEDFSLPEFSKTRGYPYCIEFFQDRMVLANTKSKPNGLWFSKSGDYTNFDEQIEDGQLTDDSAINTSVIARNDYNIKNLLTFKDLCIFTGEDERIVSGDSTITPSNILIKMQTSWGSSDEYMPFVADNRVIYIQSNNSYVRDFAYAWENDGYTGDELTLYIHHLLFGRYIVDYAYSKYPDSLVYFTLDNGEMLVMTYMRQQRIFGWSRFITQGNYINVECVQENYTDVIWFIVERDGSYYIERQPNDLYSEEPSDYCMLDSAEIYYNTTATEFTIPRFANKEVWVMTSGNLANVKIHTADADGKITIKNRHGYDKVMIGLGYDFLMTLPEVHAALERLGSIMTRNRSIEKVGLRLYLSFGGEVFVNTDDLTEPIITTRDNGLSMLTDNALYARLKSGVEEFAVNQNSAPIDEVNIRSIEPYPLKILSVMRNVDVNV